MENIITSKFFNSIILYYPKCRQEMLIEARNILQQPESIS